MRVFDFVLPDPTIREIIPTFGKIGDEAKRIRDRFNFGNWSYI